MCDISLLAIILPGFFFAIIAPFAHKWLPKYSGLLLALIPLFIFTVSCSYIPVIANNNIVKMSLPWFPDMGVDLSLYLDGLSLLFCLLISGVGTLVVIYASGYLKGHTKLGNFYGYLLMFMAAMLGLSVADNLILFFIFWELTSVSSFLLIGFNNEAASSRYAALQALLTTGSGGLAMLAGFILLSIVGDTFLISELPPLSGLITTDSTYLYILIFVLLGAFTKSAQFPFYYWLPNAMEAPTPVSAYLHSATMVKAGIFLLARFNPILGGTEVWQYTLMIVGGITMLLGAIIAVRHWDLKRILAYTTISALGILVFLIGMGTSLSITAAMGFLVVHSLYKGGLFMVTGTIDHETGTRNMDHLGGLFRYMPILGVAALLAGLSNAGIPPFFGFIGKELIYESSLSFDWINPVWITSALVVTNMLIVTTAIMAVYKPFGGKFIEVPKHPHEGPISLWIGPLILGMFGFLFGLLPGITSDYLVAPAVSSVTGVATEVKLKLWHGLNLALLLSVVTLAGGILFYIFHRSYRRALPYNEFLKKIDPESFYKSTLQGLKDFAKFQTRIFQSGFLRNYIIWVLLTMAGLVVLTVIYFGVQNFTIHFKLSDVYFYEVVICLVILMAAFVATNSPSMLAAVASLGIVGYGIALLFVIYGALDLAMTQLSVETLTVILFVLVIYKLPKMSHISSRGLRNRDKIIAACTGLLVTFIILFTISSPRHPYLSDYYLTNSYILAKGKNVVNVILVDFRALDTMGEIVVLAIASVGVFTLLKLKMAKTEKK